MKKSEIKKGKCYTAKVSGRMATVRIDADNPNGGWDATNLTTGKKIRIRSAQRLRHETRPPGKSAAEAKADQANARLADERKKASDGMTASERAMAKSATKKPGKAAGSRRRKEIAKTVEAVEKSPTLHSSGDGAGNLADGVTAPTGRKRTGGRMSCLDAAAKVLAEAGEPLNCLTMFDRMHAAGYWTSDKATPHNTIYAAILRECQKKGDESRFRKAGRGLFELNP